MLLTIACLLMRWLSGLTVLMVCGDRAKDAGLLVLRHQNAVLRRKASRAQYQPAGRAWFAFDAVFQAAGTTIVRTAVQAPRMNAIREPLIGTPLRHEVLDQTLILNQAHLRAVLAVYQEHYSTARPHQGTGQRVPDHGPGPRVTAAGPGTWQIRRKPVLSGLTREYERAA